MASTHGINLIDTAPRDVFRYNHEATGFDFSTARVSCGVDESLAQPGVEHVDFTRTHDIKFGDVGPISDETIPALSEILRGEQFCVS